MSKRAAHNSPPTAIGHAIRAARAALNWQLVYLVPTCPSRPSVPRNHRGGFTGINRAERTRDQSETRQQQQRSYRFTTSN